MYFYYAMYLSGSCGFVQYLYIAFELKEYLYVVSLSIVSFSESRIFPRKDRKQKNEE